MITALQCKLTYMSTLSERIKLALEMAGIDQSELARHIGTSSVAVNNWCTGATKSIKGANLLKASNRLGVTPEWLASGVGPMQADSGPKIDANVSPGPDVRGMLPLISWVQAGSFCDVIDNLAPGDAEAWYPCPVTHTPNAYVLRVEGESMSPEYRDGEMIFVDPRGGYVHGDDIIVRTPEGKATFKRLQVTPDGTFLLAINPAWPERIIRIPDNSQICGKVIFQGRPR